jgi:hypothetical protein
MRDGVTPHGFRTNFSTSVTDQTDTPIEMRELALAHVGDKSRVSLSAIRPARKAAPSYGKLGPGLLRR